MFNCLDTRVAILVVKSIYENIALVTDVYEFIDV